MGLSPSRQVEARRQERGEMGDAALRIGLGHPEPPFLVPESSDTLLAGDVLTLEPGLYRAGIGGMRFERNYLITETGYELLSKHRLTLEV